MTRNSIVHRKKDVYRKGREGRKVIKVRLMPSLKDIVSSPFASFAPVAVNSLSFAANLFQLRPSIHSAFTMAGSSRGEN
jgi:hypothetical protein